jgi:hypothetical protein
MNAVSVDEGAGLRIRDVRINVTTSGMGDRSEKNPLYRSRAKRRCCSVNEVHEA